MKRIKVTNLVYHAFFITCEWTDECGLSMNEMHPFHEDIEEFFKGKDYGSSLSSIRIILNILGYTKKQRKRYKKELSQLDYDILLDYFLIKNVAKDEKKEIIQRQFIEITEQTISKYRFKDFDKTAFLKDLKTVVENVNW